MNYSIIANYSILTVAGRTWMIANFFFFLGLVHSALTRPLVLSRPDPPSLDLLKLQTSVKQRQTEKLYVYPASLQNSK